MEREKKIPCETNALRAMLAISRINRAKAEHPVEVPAMRQVPAA